MRPNFRSAFLFLCCSLRSVSGPSGGGASAEAGVPPPPCAHSVGTAPSTLKPHLAWAAGTDWTHVLTQYAIKGFPVFCREFLSVV